MFEHALLAAAETELSRTIAIILLLGVGGQWLANRLRIPANVIAVTPGA